MIGPTRELTRLVNYLNANPRHWSDKLRDLYAAAIHDQHMFLVTSLTELVTPELLMPDTWNEEIKAKWKRVTDIRHARQRLKIPSGEAEQRSDEASMATRKSG